MERFCFDFPHELFPSHHQSELKEGYGRFSGWLPGGIFKRLGIQMRLSYNLSACIIQFLFTGRHDKVYNPLSSCFPLYKPNLCKDMHAR